VPGTARLAVAMGVPAFGLDLFMRRGSLGFALIGRSLAVNVLLPAAILALKGE
jgi:branched-chain amino acid transport system permease protein